MPLFFSYVLKPPGPLDTASNSLAIRRVISASAAVASRLSSA